MSLPRLLLAPAAALASPPRPAILQKLGTPAAQFSHSHNKRFYSSQPQHHHRQQPLSQPQHKAQPQPQKQKRPDAANPSYPSFSLKDLGANRVAKTVVVVGLGILATMETVFWVKVGWAKFGLGATTREEDKEG